MPVRRVPEDWPDRAARFGQKVKARREELSLTQEQLAEITGISRNQIQNIEHSRNNRPSSDDGRPGPGNPRLDTVYVLAQHLRVEIAYLVDPDKPVSSPYGRIGH